MSNKTKPVFGLRPILALTAIGGVSLGASGCIEDTDCGVCDPDSLILESISGVNYASRSVSLLNPPCRGENCPGDFDEGPSFTDEIGPCEIDEETIRNLGDFADNPDFQAEYCKLSPLVTAFGVEFVFNNLLDATTVELVRRRPDNPQLFEVYDWKTRIVELEGPITRWNGDYESGASEQPDLMTRLVNLSCIDNLRDQNVDFSNETYEDPETNPCNRFDPNTLTPLKMRVNGTVKSYRGLYTAGTNSCSSPEDGVDTCCSECDWLLTAKVDRYGVDEGGTPRNANVNLGLIDDGTPQALSCDAAAGDKYLDCRGFSIGVDRAQEDETWSYYWDCPPGEAGCQPGTFKLPYYDRLRETHPDDRPRWLENFDAKCTATSQCTGDPHNLPGTSCIGTNSDGAACSVDANVDGDCAEGVCRAEWFVGCLEDVNTLGGGNTFCADRRFDPVGTASCLWTPAGSGSITLGCDDDGVCPSGSDATVISGRQQLINCDTSADGRLSAGECCQSGLLPGDEKPANCDPFYQTELGPFPTYVRDENLPSQTGRCRCTESDLNNEDCSSIVRTSCLDESGNIRDERRDQYATKFVSRRGGVVYDPAVKGFDFRPADLGGVPRADIENCAEARNLVGRRNRHEGWRANDSFTPENFEDFDRAMCSGQTYTVRFAEPEEGGEYLLDKVGNSLAGKSEYTFETSPFHVVPGSGFPTDNLRIGACDKFQLRFSNKFDTSEENLDKVVIYRVETDDDGNFVSRLPPNESCSEVVPVAGGPNCVETKAELDADPCASACLTVNIEGQALGELEVEIDPAEFGPVLDQDLNPYMMEVQSLTSFDENTTQEEYYNAFWDVCGMPLVSENALQYSYIFNIDQPKCEEDEDLDGVQLSCDNADDVFNPDQGDIDQDGFGDVLDLCPTVAGTSNTADSDNDGVGNECDSCRQTVRQYNRNAKSGSVPAYMQVRNIPDQTDSDQDGIGDVCDNCVVQANCEDFGPERPWEVGDSIEFDNESLCQRDENTDMVGDVCQGAQADGAAGPVGFADDDDFDQDGIINIDDACPRQPLPERISCTDDSDCVFATCENGICNHTDSEPDGGDGVGDICDSCPGSPNPMQVVEGGAQEDDEDGDFVGDICETAARCQSVKDPRPFGFYPVSANGSCCTVQLIAEEGTGNLRNVLTDIPLLDPFRRPLRMPEQCSAAQEEADECRPLEPSVVERDGIVTPPAGCEQALADAGITAVENARSAYDLTDDFGGDTNAYWQTLCFLPQEDQDFDGLGEVCDDCKFDYDPDNLPFVDENGRLWNGDGLYCNGTFAETRCEGADDSGGSSSGSTGGADGGTGEGSGG